MALTNWRVISPKLSREISLFTTGILTLIVGKFLAPESWATIKSLIGFAWVIIPAWIVYFVLDSTLMAVLGRRKRNGQIETYKDPLQARLERIETAISRLHSYVQELDPELEEELRLWEKFNSGDIYGKRPA